jgi:hypothetical protein
MDIDLKRLQSMVCALVQELISGLVYAKTFTANWDSKRHLLELSWPK